MVAAVLASFALVQIGFYAVGMEAERIYNGLDTRASQLLIGCLLYFVLDTIRVPSGLAIVSLVALLAASLSLRHESGFYLSAGIPLVGLLSALLVGSMAQGRQGWHAPFLLVPVQWGGSRSYAIYLWHYPLIGLFKSAGVDNLLTGIGAAVATCVAAEASMRLIERPARTLRVRFDHQAALGKVP